MEKMKSLSEVQFLAESLCKHSRYVLDYCRKTWKNIHDFKPDKRMFYLTDFIKDANELAGQLAGMLDKAGLLQSKGYLNFEQLEAESVLIQRIICTAEIELEFLLGSVKKTTA
ncbi:MAG: hypothetical protein ACYTFY_10545 [Planctomycetota bacterium]|jgi:hypothetical protein